MTQTCIKGYIGVPPCNGQRQTPLGGVEPGVCALNLTGVLTPSKRIDSTEIKLEWNQREWNMGKKKTQLDMKLEKVLHLLTVYIYELSIQ